MRRRFNQNEFQGLGIYQQARTPHNPAFGQNYERYNPGNVFEAAGAYEMVGGVGQLPEVTGLPSLSAMETYVVIDGLKFIPTNTQTQVIAVLEVFTFLKDDPNAVEPITGEASYIPPAFLATNWLHNLVDSGYVVMASSAGIMQGKLLIVATKNPALVYSTARDGADGVIISGDRGVIDAAIALGRGGATPGGATPGGAVVPGGGTVPGSAVVPATGSKPLPGWVIPVVIGGSLLLITLGIVAMNKSKSPAIAYTDY